MAKVRNPSTFSSQFGVDPALLDKFGVLDPTLALDTKLFIDPLLLQNSRTPEIKSEGVNQYREHFESILKLLVASRHRGDAAWRSARRLMTFHELPGTCLGYGASSISGSGFGPELTERLLSVAKDIVNLGIEDPDLFPLMALFESNIGPDRISDMTTNVIIEALGQFNARVLKAIRVDTELFMLKGRSVDLVRNPLQPRRIPVILVPKDILRALPIAGDWDGIGHAAALNEELKSRVNKHIGHIWANHADRDSEKLRKQAMYSREAFETLLDAVHEVPRTPYDVGADPNGYVKWVRAAEEFSKKYPLKVRRPTSGSDLHRVFDITRQIVAKFRHLLEANGLNAVLYKDDGSPRHESVAQRLFFAIAHSYCEANNLDISPEVDTGSGLVDFKLSTGWTSKVLVEVKLSSNPKVVHGYEKQLETYKQAEKTMRAIYLVIVVGEMKKKAERLFQLRNEASEAGKPLSELEFVDAIPKPPASKRE